MGSRRSTILKTSLRVATVQYANFAYSLTAWDEEPEWNDFTFGLDPEDREPWNAPIMFHQLSPTSRGVPRSACTAWRMRRLGNGENGEDLTLG